VSSAATPPVGKLKNSISDGMLADTTKSVFACPARTLGEPIKALTVFPIMVFGGVAAKELPTIKTTKSALKSALDSLNSS
jgi:hypothetical protein